MRIEFGGAFADLLNEKGKGSGDNEMGYVERTIGFRTRDLDARDLRLVLSLPVLSMLYTRTFATYNFSSKGFYIKIWNRDISVNSVYTMQHIDSRWNFDLDAVMEIV